MHQQLQLLDALQEHITRLEARIVGQVQSTPIVKLIQTIPGPARVLSIVIDREPASIDRFACAKHFTSYCGLVPKLSGWE
jgi:transposase